MVKIWCLFSVEREHDQPANNLVGWWEIKPSIEKLAGFLACSMEKATDEQIVAVVNIWSGKAADIRTTQYRLEEVIEGGVS